jgi:hypothetical protein
MVSDENSNEMHWALMSIDPDLFEITKKISEGGRKKVLTKEEKNLLEIV